MRSAEPGDVVFDTTIYYKDSERVGRWADSEGFRPFFTPNNAIELITPPVGSSGPEFDKRKQAVRNLLDLTKDQPDLPDSELVHCFTLGFQIEDTASWREACDRFLTMPNATPASWKAAGLNLQAAMDAVDAAYGAYTAKVQTYQAAHDREWKTNKEELKSDGVTYEAFKSKERVDSILSELRALDSIVAAHVDRIVLVAKELGFGGSLVAENDRAKAIAHYCRAYHGYVRYSISTNKRDKNDFGDLQFFSYCDAGYKLVSSENRWNEISIAEELTDLLVRFV